MKMGLHYILVALLHLFFITHVTARPYPGREHDTEEGLLSRHLPVPATRPLPDDHSAKLKRHDDMNMPSCHITDRSLRDIVARQLDVLSVVGNDDLVRQYAFDGIDINCWCPGASNGGGKPEDKENSVIFLKELNTKCWDNCARYGEPGPCDDNHCDSDYQVQLTSDDYDSEDSRYPGSKRTTVYCCEIANGALQFLPAPLEDLFPRPSTVDEVDVGSLNHLKSSNAWDTESAETDSEGLKATSEVAVPEPLEELQVSLDKDEVSDCKDTPCEDAQTVCMHCRNENTVDCGKFHLGHGAPGRIVGQLPGYGPSRIAAVRSLVHAEEQKPPGRPGTKGHADGPLPETSRRKRARSYGSLIQQTKTGCYGRPETGDDNSTDCETVSGWEPSQLQASDDNELIFRRHHTGLDDSLVGDHTSAKRDVKRQDFCIGKGKMDWIFPSYDSSGKLAKGSKVHSYGHIKPNVCNNFEFGLLRSTSTNTPAFATEHILEFQLVAIFFDALDAKLGDYAYNSPIAQSQKMVSPCQYLEPYGQSLRVDKQTTVDRIKDKPLKLLSSQFPSTKEFQDEFVLLEKGMNRAKEGMWGRKEINAYDTMINYVRTDPWKAIKNLKDVLAAYKYHAEPEVLAALVTQRNRVGQMLAKIERAMAGTSYSVTRRGDLRTITYAGY